MDSLEWVKLAKVTKVSFSDQGVFVDADVQPDGFPVRAKLATLWAGAGIGIYWPVKAGDQVLVAFPDGNPDGNPVALAGLFNETSTVPAEAKAEQETFWIVSAAGKQIKIKAGAGSEAHVLAGKRVLVQAPQVNVDGSTLTVLGDSGTLTAADGVVTGACPCAFTGLPHAVKSAVVRARKV